MKPIVLSIKPVLQRIYLLAKAFASASGWQLNRLKMLIPAFCISFSLAGCAGSGLEDLPGAGLIEKIETVAKAQLEKNKAQTTLPPPQKDSQTTETAPATGTRTVSRVKYYEAVRLTGDPIENYTRIGRLVHKCWLKSQIPFLKGLVYYAEAERTKYGPKALISLHLAAELGRKGRVTFIMKMQGTASSTSLSAVNYKIDLPIANQMAADLVRWSQKDYRCRIFQLPQTATASHTKASLQTDKTAQMELPARNPRIKRK